jgi:hypothetical protein
MNTTAARAAIQAAGWRDDMENAPRDGTHVLFIGRKGVVVQAKWRGDAWVLAIQINERDVVLEGGVAWKPLDTPDAPDPVAAHLEAALDREAKLEAALNRIQDEANTVGGDWRETASLIDSICISALLEPRHDD